MALADTAIGTFSECRTKDRRASRALSGQRLQTVRLGGTQPLKCGARTVVGPGPCGEHRWVR
jgi:hypothetical protein